ncbi:ferrisiderophore receptor [Thalassobaculum fulvum]|uniref:Ferrisiderophore receptor n=1 Tax=Thalassobaculum fulvum TaxID=1633335 RepID=A0A918XQC5_9PROT|nr:ferrisiderophore receptor [Thalassobaculum fulvum]
MALISTLTAAPAHAQTVTGTSASDSVVLEPVTVEGTGQRTGGSLGPTIPRSSGTATKTDTPVTEISRSISIETRQQIVDKGGQRLEDTYLYSAGVRGGTYGYDLRGNWASIRGFDIPAEYLDGLQFDNSLYYNNTLPEVPLLERVEIIKGPAGSLYGNSTVGGLLNAVSKRPEAETSRRITAEYGTHERKQTTLDVTGRIDEQGKVLGRFVGLLRDSETQVDHGRNDAIALAPSLTFRPTPDTDITVLGRYQKQDGTPDTQFLSRYGTVEPAYNGRYLSTGTFVGEPGFDKLEAESAAITIDADHRLNDIWSLGGAVRYSESNSHYNHAWWAYADYPTRYASDGTIDRTFYTQYGSTQILVGDVNATADFRTGPVTHKLLFGAAYNDTTADNDTGYGTSTGRIDPFNPVYTGIPSITVADTPAVNFKQAGVYAQDQLRIYDRWLVTAGARWDQVETDNPNSGINASDSDITVNLGLMYKFDNGISPYVSYNESFRQENFGTDVNGASFDPTRGVQYEVGVKYEIPGVPSLITASVFEITKSNILVTDPDNPTYKVQSGEATSRGFELEGQVKLGEFEVEANYAFLKTEGDDGEPLYGIPDHAASTWVTWRPGGTWEGFKAGAGVRYVGSSHGYSGADGADSYTLGDAMIGYEFDTWDLTLNVRNLTDETYVTSADSTTGYYGERRTIVLRLGVNF